MVHSHCLCIKQVVCPSLGIVVLGNVDVSIMFIVLPFLLHIIKRILSNSSTLFVINFLR